MQLLTAKPVIYLVNVSQEDYIRKKNKWCAPWPPRRGRWWPARRPLSAPPPSPRLCWLLPASQTRPRLPKIKQWIDAREVYEGAVPLIPFSCELESKISTMSAAERDEYLKSLGTTSVLPKIIVTGYKALQLIYFFTAGADEVRAWTIRVRGRARRTARAAVGC